MYAGRRQQVADGVQASVPWRLSRSAIDLIGLAGAEFARNVDFGRVAYRIHCVDGGAQISQFGLVSSGRIQHFASALAWCVPRARVRALTGWRVDR
jgi:hypothetical protein